MLGAMRANNASFTRASTPPGEEDPEAVATPPERRRPRSSLKLLAHLCPWRLLPQAPPGPQRGSGSRRSHLLPPSLAGRSIPTASPLGWAPPWGGWLAGWFALPSSPAQPARAHAFLH